jgi:hypothetical protein
MRELPVTFALSLLIHTVALVGYVTIDHSEPSRPVTKPAVKVEILEPLEDPPVEVALLDSDTVNLFPDAEPLPQPVAVAAVAKVTPREKTRVTPVPEAIAVTTQTTTELPPKVEPPTTDPKKKPGSLSMRGGRPEPTIHRPGSEGISDEALEKMAKGDIPVKIQNLPGAKESADFDKANARLSNDKWVQNATPEELAQARWDREAARQAKKEVELVAQKDGTHTSEKTTFKATVNRDGTVDIKDKKNWQQKSLFRAEFDVTDAFMRNNGQDPYASEKRKFLDRTRDQRVEIGKQYRKEQLGQSAKLMASNLARLWAITTDPAKRKDELFALWDECAETGDDAIVEGGAAARRLLINWVHAKHVTFTHAELTAFNAKRKSKATFAP